MLDDTKVNGRADPGIGDRVMGQHKPTPSHYYDRGGISCQKYITAKDMTYNEGNIVKYVTRWRHKGSPREDLYKLREYVDFLIRDFERNALPPY